MLYIIKSKIYFSKKTKNRLQKKISLSKFFKIGTKYKKKSLKTQSHLSLKCFTLTFKVLNSFSLFVDSNLLYVLSKEQPIKLISYTKTRRDFFMRGFTQDGDPVFIEKFNSLNLSMKLNIYFISFYFNFFLPSSKLKVTGEKNIKKTNTLIGDHKLYNQRDILLPLLYNERFKKQHLQGELNYSFLNGYMRGLIFGYTGFDTDWFFFNIEPSTVLTKYLVILHKVFTSRQQRFLKIKKHFYFRLLIQLSLLKSPKLLILALEHLFIKTPIKRHRSIFFRLRHLLKVWYFICRKKRCLKGFSFFFKGKLGKKGSVRKRKFFTKKGLISFTNKELRVNYSNYILWTNTGCIGANISIFFNVYGYINCFLYALIYFNFDCNFFLSVLLSNTY